MSSNNDINRQLHAWIKDIGKMIDNLDEKIFFASCHICPESKDVLEEMRGVIERMEEMNDGLEILSGQLEWDEDAKVEMFF